MMYECECKWVNERPFPKGALGYREGARKRYMCAVNLTFTFFHYSYVPCPSICLAVI